MIISEMQHKLATWATADPTRRFDRLLRLITDRNWLAEAARIVLASKGANTPGLDGMDKRRLAVDLDRRLDRLRVTLLDGSYCPTPVKRIHIPKANGKLRPLGIPILLDRIVQRAMLMAMEPIWESDFHSGSYGFRPERSVHHAVRTVRMQLQDGSDSKGRWIIEGDLASYLDVASYYTFSFFERVEEVRSNCRYLNSYAFCPSAIDVNGLKLAALYTLQDGLPRDAE